MRFPMGRAALLAAGLLAAGALLTTAACGGGGKDEAPTATRGAGNAATQPAGGGEGTTIKLVALNILYEKTEFEAPAGKVTIEIENKDAGVPHNVHIYKGEDASGQDMGLTELTAGPDTQRITLDLQAGEYFFVCDVHPTTMSGKLKIE